MTAPPHPAQASVPRARSLPSTAARATASHVTRSKAGDAPGNIGPPLADMKARFPNRKELVAIIYRRNQAQSADGNAAVRT